MRTLTGTAYRCPSGYTHGQRDMLNDILHFETEELGNDDNLLPGVDPALLTTTRARDCAWVALCHEDAMRYGSDGEVIEIELDHAPIIASDGDGGLLVISPHIHC